MIKNHPSLLEETGYLRLVDYEHTHKNVSFISKQVSLFMGHRRKHNGVGGVERRRHVHDEADDFLHLNTKMTKVFRSDPGY